jgi:hypothetical protein
MCFAYGQTGSGKTFVSIFKCFKCDFFYFWLKTSSKLEL